MDDDCGHAHALRMVVVVLICFEILLYYARLLLRVVAVVHAYRANIFHRVLPARFSLCNRCVNHGNITIYFRLGRIVYCRYSNDKEIVENHQYILYVIYYVYIYILYNKVIKKGALLTFIDSVSAFFQVLQLIT